MMRLPEFRTLVDGSGRDGYATVSWSLPWHLRTAEPAGFFRDEDFYLQWLHRFRDRLTPEAMREDLRFEPAPDLRPFRETVRTF